MAPRNILQTPELAQKYISRTPPRINHYPSGIRHSNHHSTHSSSSILPPRSPRLLCQHSIAISLNRLLAPPSRAFDHLLNPSIKIFSLSLISQIIRNRLTAGTCPQDPIQDTPRPKISITLAENVAVDAARDAAEDEICRDYAVARVGECLFDGDEGEVDQVC